MKQVHPLFRATGTRLDVILASVAERAAARRQVTPLPALEASARTEAARELEPRHRSVISALRRSSLALIAEVKRRSPAEGMLAGAVDVGARARAYARGGARMISVLTEEDHFHGSAADVAHAAIAGVPLLRKDFILDEGMVLESVAMGVHAVLLLAVCHAPERLAALRALAREVGLGVLIEVHDERELDAALECEPECVGVNARDLRTFAVDLGTVERLLPRIPTGLVRVAESGLRGPADLRRVRAAGADAALIGEALMRSVDPEATLRTWAQELEVTR